MDEIGRVHTHLFTLITDPSVIDMTDAGGIRAVPSASDGNLSKGVRYG
jgi:hypothetical protein